jgi:formylglycine-generating enzyme required for sulfatase activity
MVTIPTGIFVMGSPSSEGEESEIPQHLVAIEPFLMSKYPVTQAQWQAISALEPVKFPLDRNPSKFQGMTRPVERVSWYEAVEFCQRLSRLCGKRYRLPSEAEWEYACQAQTRTPSHLGERLALNLGNARRFQSLAHESHAVRSRLGAEPNGTPVGVRPWRCRRLAFSAGVRVREPAATRIPRVFDPPQAPELGSGERRPASNTNSTGQGTLPVGLVGTANNFGLHDMYGNVYQWCLDRWHDNYEGAPLDGSAWLAVEEEEELRVIRGGFWQSYTKYCRSAHREFCESHSRTSVVGFRVVSEI